VSDEQTVSRVPIEMSAKPVDKPLFDRARAVAALEQHLRRALRVHFRYPGLARRRGWEGDVVLEVHVAADGQLTNVAVLQTSGHDLLDRAALRALQRVTVLPQAIAHLQGRDLDLLFPVHYRLVGG
jgi:protein TonB